MAEQDTGPITTATSESEGRLIVGVTNKTAKKRHLKSILKKHKDGRGGPGTSITDLIPSAAQANPSLTALTPGMGVAVTPNTYSPQQKMQLSSMGMTPISAQSTPPTTNRTAAPAAVNRMTYKPHSTIANIRPKGMKKMKSLKIQSLQSSIRAATKRPKLSF